MKYKQSSETDFIHPYRENKRWFSKYLNKANDTMNISMGDSNKQQSILNGVSLASSIKVKQSIQQSKIKKFQYSCLEQSNQEYLIQNRQKNLDLINPQLFNLISKHISSDKKIKITQNKISNYHTKSISLKKVSKLSSPQPYQLNKLQITPKITQFSRHTFYKNIKTSRNYLSSKKQNQDNLHCKSDLDINTKKISLYKKTKTNADKKIFYTYQIYSLNMRIGINVEILAGSLKQIKFRLILNQSDTKTFNKFWRQKIQQFIQKCLIINDLGISLKVGPFNQINPKNSRIKQLQKLYLQHHKQSIVKKQQNRKLSAKKIGNKLYSQQYDGTQLIELNNKINQNLQSNLGNIISINMEEYQKFDAINMEQIRKQQTVHIKNEGNIKQEQKKQENQLIKSFIQKQQSKQIQSKQQQQFIESQQINFEESKPQQIIGQSIG